MTVRSYLPQAIVKIEGALRVKNEAAAILVENRAKELCPVDTGELRASITHDADTGGFIVGTNTEYAPFVELGTRYQTPQPYLVPAVQGAVNELLGIYNA